MVLSRLTVRHVVLSGPVYASTAVKRPPLGDRFTRSGHPKPISCRRSTAQFANRQIDLRCYDASEQRLGSHAVLVGVVALLVASIIAAAVWWLL